ncbi:hypothetical protein [Agrobacterium vaccinii]|uniref:hypothetical protein n=1 Tax=Agrobacterium vaccinii TaxID=2735528 RepID=UPI001E307EF2|nr:hypothetical protein [Agrobacterium vaccinii]UHS57270.1 hypothetical protein HRS00_10845 [Agrobacterium vaccinii]
MTANNSTEELMKGASYVLGWSSAFAQSKGHTRKNGKRAADLTSLLAKEIILAQTLACSQVGSVGISRFGRAEVAFWPISSRRAAKELGVTPGSFEAIAKTLGIYSGKSAPLRPVNESQFTAISDFLSRSVNSRKARKEVGCTQAQLQRLAYRGFIRRINYSSKKASRYRADDVSEIGQRIAALPQCKGQEITVAEAARRRCTSESAIMVAFLKGDYPVAFKTSKGAGFNSLRLPDTIPSRRPNRGGKPQAIGIKDARKTAMLRAEFRVMTGLCSKSMSALVKHNHLHLLVDDGEEPRLDREQAMSFHAKFMKPNPYMKCSYRLLRKELTLLGVPIHFSDICPSLIVEREVFEAATSIVTIPKDARVLDLWESLRSAFTVHAPSFSIPQSLTASRMGVWTTAMKAYFLLHVEERSFRFEKKFDPKQFRREYALYAADPARFRAALSVFEWQDTGDVAEFIASTPEEIECAAVALGRMCDLLRVKQPAIQRKRKD